MVYKVCEQRPGEPGTHIVNVLDDHVTEEEYLDYVATINKIGFFDRIDFFLKLITYNGRLLSNHLTTVSSTSSKELRKNIELTNKYIYDFAASFGSFIDYIEKRIIKKQSTQIQEEFKLVKAKYFQDDVYKFWYYMRNYVIHYDIPFNRGEALLEDGKEIVKIISDKNHLLKYQEWKHAKAFVSQLDDEVNIQQLIEPLLVIIYAYYLDLLFIFRELIVETHRYVTNFILKHKARYGIAIMAYKTEQEALENKKGNLKFLSINKVDKRIKDLSNHPNANITFVKME